MRFRTEIEIPPIDPAIEHHEPIMMIGSCFSDHIARILKNSKFNILANPFGILYNPGSIFNSLKLLERTTPVGINDLTGFNGQWHSFSHHGSFSGPDHDEVCRKINKALDETRAFLNRCTRAIITFGSAFYHTYKKNGRIVSNCHKIPAREFDQNRFSAEQVEQYTVMIIDVLRQFNPAMHFVFTVSPVRYLKYGLHENQLSKAALLLGIENAIGSDPHTYYFPSYEVMMDDLRDYRFYAPDLIQPGAQGIDYIWEKFQSACLSSSCLQTIKNLEPLIKGVNHRTVDKNNPENRKFIKKMNSLVKDLEKEYPYLDFSSERKHFAK